MGLGGLRGLYIGKYPPPQERKNISQSHLGEKIRKGKQKKKGKIYKKKEEKGKKKEETGNKIRKGEVKG
jgi:hypothetical protein